MSHVELARGVDAVLAAGEPVGHRMPGLRERQDAARRALGALPPPTWRRGRGFSLTPDPIDVAAYRPWRPARGAAGTGEDHFAVGDEADTLVLVDGVLVGPARSLPKGFEVWTLGPGGSDLLPPEVAGQVGTVVPPDADFFSALNLAALTGAVLVRVPRGTTAERPLRIRHLLRTQGALALGRVVVWLEEGASATIMEESLSGEADRMERTTAGAATDALMANVTELVAGPAAHLVYVDVSDLAPTHRAILRRRAVLQRDSRMEWRSALFGGRFVATDWETELAGEGSYLEATGTYLAAGRDQFALTSRTWHRAPHTQAQVLFRGAAYGTSQSVFDGIIGADKTAKGTKAYLADHLLFLSPHARADSIPSLLIEGDDVQVGHGATIGRIDPEQVYFMQSRGIAPHEARRMLVAGYFEPVLDRIPDEALREAQRAAIARRLADIADAPEEVGAAAMDAHPLAGTDLETEPVLRGGR